MNSCAQTKLISSWRDDSYRGNIKKVIIIGAAEKPGLRKIFEQEFSNQLKAHGIIALPSNQIIPSDGMLDKQIILSKIKDLNVDAVLITRLVEKRTKMTHFPNWHDYYTGSRGRVFKDEIVNLETNLYEIKTEKLVWSALSETIFLEGDSVYKEIRSIIKVVVNNLFKEKLI
jgi:hypothetical protein